ncbi:hypothetical protein IGI04_002000, partial [Brassica rapa subsp. trilocularis]
WIRTRIGELESRLDTRLKHIHRTVFFSAEMMLLHQSPNEKEDDISYCFKRSGSIAGHVTDVLKGLLTVRIVSLNYLKHKPIAHSSNIINCLLLQQLMIEGGTANAIFFRCFVAKKGTETELKRRLHVVFPRWSLATIYVMLVFLTAYVSAAMEQLFLFHLVLIRKLDSSSVESSDFDSPERPRHMLISKFMFKKAHNQTIQKDIRRWAFNFFHADQQETRFPCKQTFVEEDILSYFRPGINGIKLMQGSKVLIFWSTARKK